MTRSTRHTKFMQLDTSALIEPLRLAFPPPWVGHIPFGAWLVAHLRPRVLVELGTHSGNSYCAFCQSIVENRVEGQAFAVDTWQGDAHASEYGSEVFEDLSQHHDGRYGQFSTLLRMTFDEALSQFADGSVDLLHIDGLHTYEAVRHDFDSWRPKLSSRSVVLLHDTHERSRDFGVHQLLDEMRAEFPVLAFDHSHGLGVVLVGIERDDLLFRISQDPGLEEAYRRAFASLGRSTQIRYEQAQHPPEEIHELRLQLDAHRRSVHEYSVLTAELRERIATEERRNLVMVTELEHGHRDHTAALSALDAARSELRAIKRGRLDAGPQSRKGPGTRVTERLKRLVGGNGDSR